MLPVYKRKCFTRMPCNRRRGIRRGQSKIMRKWTNNYLINIEEEKLDKGRVIKKIKGSSIQDNFRESQEPAFLPALRVIKLAQALHELRKSIYR